MSLWAFSDICLLAAGVILVVFSEIYRMPNLMINFTLTNDMLLGTFLNYAIRLSLIFFSGGLVTGIFLLITFAFSIGAIVQKNHVTGGLVILNWLLVVDAIVILIVGTVLWFFSLQQRANYLTVFQAASPTVRIEIQDKVRYPRC